jgi:DNA-directed RNA polymerase subunit omega
MLPSPDILNDYPLGKFVLSNLAAKRAKQLREGALPLVQIESRHPLTIALAEIAAGKIEPRMLAIAVDAPVGDGLQSVILGDDIVPGEFGMLLPALDENESVLIDVVGLEDADGEPLDDAGSDSDELSLSDLADGEDDEEETNVVESEDDTLSLSDIAEEEEALSDDENPNED